MLLSFPAWRFLAPKLPRLRSGAGRPCHLVSQLMSSVATITASLLLSRRVPHSATLTLSQLHATLIILLPPYTLAQVPAPIYSHFSRTQKYPCPSPLRGLTCIFASLASVYPPDPKHLLQHHLISCSRKVDLGNLNFQMKRWRLRKVR